MQEQNQIKQSELIKLKHLKKMKIISKAISHLSKDTIAAAFIRIASDVIQTQDELDDLLAQLNEIEKEIIK